MRSTLAGPRRDRSEYTRRPQRGPDPPVGAQGRASTRRAHASVLAPRVCDAPLRVYLWGMRSTLAGPRRDRGEYLRGVSKFMDGLGVVGCARVGAI